jgi:hypothetical protein
MMKTIQRTQFNGTPEQLAARVQAFKDALAAHAETVGVPAPREEDWIEALARTGEPYELQTPPEEPKPPTAEELAAHELMKKRAIALRALDEKRLQAAALDPNAPQEVKDYAAARDALPAR